MDIVPIESVRETTRIEAEEEPIELGQWYWTNCGEKGEWLGCVVVIGSNYAEIESPQSDSWRVHFNEFAETCRREHDPFPYINGKIQESREEVQSLMGRIKALMSKLGVQPALGGQAGGDSGAHALVKVSQTPDVSGYKRALVKAKDKELPDLFEQVRKAHETMATWMKAEMLPMQAAAGDMKESIAVIEDRLFNISIYAGLAEKAVLVRDGEPAGITEKLRVIQRRLYMDEECLLDYQHGGMVFKELAQFDRWLAKDKNFLRVLPFERSIVAFRVRRDKKDRRGDGTLSTAFINVRLGQLDEQTFFYIRNGQKLYRIKTELEFGDKIFPDREELDMTRPKMFKHWSGIKFMELDEFERMMAEQEETQRLHDEWEKANPDDHWMDNPHRDHGLHSRDDWEPFDPESVYYDEGMKKITDRVKYFNRISLIIQGLFDRSEALHPHPPVRLWDNASFAQSVELVYEENRLAIDPPDFKRYRAGLNLSLGVGSITIGQEDFWELREGEKETTRRYNSYHYRDNCHVDRYSPYGNPGPGLLAEVQTWQPKAKKAIYRWERERLTTTSRWGPDGPIPVTLTVPGDDLLNISAYKPGDFLQFFNDPSVRAQYLKWAPMLLAAEEYHAGTIDMEGNFKPKPKRKKKS